MAKKNKKKSKNRANKQAKKLQKQHFKQAAAHAFEEAANTERGLVPTQPVVEKTETTFSKKLEEEIADIEDKAKKGFFKGRIILLGPPDRYKDVDWRGVWSRFTRGLIRFVIIVLILGVASSAVVALEVLSDSRIMPRVALAQQDIGYLKLEEAKANLLDQLNKYQQKSLVFNYGEQTVEIPLTDLGITIDIERTLNQLPAFNFQQDSFVDLLGATLSEQKITPVYQKDDHKIFKLVEAKLGLNEQRAKSARFIINEEKKLAVVPEAEGKIISQSNLVEQLNAHLNSLSTEGIEVETLRELPIVTAVELEQSQADLQVKLENKIAIKYGDQSWEFKAIDHLGEIDSRKENDQVIITVLPNLIDNYLNQEIFSKIEEPVSHLKIYYNEADKIIFEGKARDGLEVKKTQFIADLEMAINSLDQEVEIFTEVKKAEMEIDQRLQEQGIKELIGVGHTAFAGSPTNRRHNISTGMSKFEGLIIKPGETFSFNYNLGEVDGSTGYKLELVIKAEGTIPEYGGGICQVSSTFFKAALHSGLPIVERKPHSYAVGYYAQVDGYGLDSTIYPGVVDLKFTNDTPASILVQPYVDGTEAYVNFFGTSDGRQVRLENYWRGNYRGAGGTQLIPTKTLPPGARKQIEAAHGGFDASWDRVITKNGEEVREKIYSVYRATSNRILVGEG